MLAADVPMCVSGTDTFPDINHICQFRTKKTNSGHFLK